MIERSLRMRRRTLGIEAITTVVERPMGSFSDSPRETRKSK